MAIGYADKRELIKHDGHALEIAVYGLDMDSVTIECIDCNEVLIDNEEEEEIE